MNIHACKLLVTDDLANYRLMANELCCLHHRLSSSEQLARQISRTDGQTSKRHCEHEIKIKFTAVENGLFHFILYS